MEDGKLSRQALSLKKSAYRVEILQNLEHDLASTKRGLTQEYDYLKDADGNAILDENGSKKWGYVDITEETASPEEIAEIKWKSEILDEIAESLLKLVK